MKRILLSLSIMLLLMVAGVSFAGEIQGTVVDSDGIAVDEAWVQVVPLIPQRTHRGIVYVRGRPIRTQTDESGAFEFVNVRPAFVIIQAMKRDVGTDLMRGSVPEEGVLTVELQLQENHRRHRNSR